MTKIRKGATSTRINWKRVHKNEIEEKTNKLLNSVDGNVNAAAIKLLSEHDKDELNEKIAALTVELEKHAGEKKVFACGHLNVGVCAECFAIKLAENETLKAELENAYKRNDEKSMELFESVKENVALKSRLARVERGKKRWYFKRCAECLKIGRAKR